MVLGKSGDGKSTLLYNMLKENYKYISEEISFTYTKNIKSYIFMSNRIIRLNNDMYEKKQNDLIYCVTDKIGFWNDQFIEAEMLSELSTIIVLNKNKECNKISIEKMDKSKVIDTILKKYLYTRSIIKWFPFSKIIQIISELVRSADCFLITYPLFLSANDIMELQKN